MSDQLPEEFLCPISHQIMSDPVILPCGHTFDRPSIQQALASQLTCPISMRLLPDDLSLVPNLTLLNHIRSASQILPMSDQLPPDFLCPISEQIMKDPVVLPCGHTFDLLSFLRWPDAGHLPCGHTFDRLSIQRRPDAGDSTYPISNLPLPDKPFLVPNFTLRSLISRVAPIHCLQRPELKLVAALASSSSTVESKLEALDRLIELSKQDSACCCRLIESSTVSVILDCVDSDNGFLRERTLRLLLNLSSDNDNKVMLVAAEGAISKIIDALGANSANCRMLAAKIITSLMDVEDNWAAIGKHPFTISALICFMRVENCEELKEAAKALVAVCKSPENRKGAATKESVMVLMRAVDSGIEEAVEVLAMLARCSEGREVMGTCDRCVMVLVEVLRNGDLKGILCALVALYWLCYFDSSICEEVRMLGVFDMCKSLQKAGDRNVEKKAAALAHLLRTNSNLQ